MRQSRRSTLKQKFGQYFTPEAVAEFMIDLAELGDTTGAILEPSCGEGVFLKLLRGRGFRNLVGYEIDPSLAREHDCVRRESFVGAVIPERFDLVIGNPPYIRWANLEPELKEELTRNRLWNTHFNSLCDYLYIFILKSIEVLKDGGRLVFICPEYWLSSTHSLPLRNYMVERGFFESLYRFNETPMFEGVSLSAIIFIYKKTEKKRLENKSPIRFAEYSSSKTPPAKALAALKAGASPDNAIAFRSIPQFQRNERWTIADDATRHALARFENACRKRLSETSLFDADREYHTLGDFCDIGNGLVSGLDKAFQLNGETLNECESKATLAVVKAKDLRPFYYDATMRYLFAQDAESETELAAHYPTFYRRLQAYKPALERRYSYNRDIPYWQWVFLRNFALFSRPEARIFVPCKERVSHKNYVRFAVVEAGVYPTQDVTAIFKRTGVRESVYYLAALLNNVRAFEWLRWNGIVKGNIIEFSERPLSSLPFRTIDWSDERERILHDQISNLCQRYISDKRAATLTALHDLTDQLFEDETV